MTWHKLRTLILAILGMVLLGIGGVGLASPATVAGWVGLTPGGPGALGELRALYGGAMLAAGIVLLLSLRMKRLRSAQLVLGVLFAGFVLGRLLSLSFDGFSTYTSLALLFEGVCTGLLLAPVGERPGAGTAAASRPGEPGAEQPRPGSTSGPRGATGS